jgi:hypothetical protein
MADSLNIADIAAELTEHARDNKDHIYEAVYGLGEDESDMENSIPAMSEYCDEIDTPDEVILTKITPGNVLQPGGVKTASGKVFNVTNDAVKIDARVAKVRHTAMNFLFTQEKLIRLKKSYFSAVRSKKMKADEIPFSEYVMRAIENEAKEELRLAYFQASYNAQGTTFLQLFDGWIAQILAAIVSGEILAGNITDTAVLSATNSVAENEKIIANIPTKYLSKVVCLTSRLGKKNFEDDYKARWGVLPWNTGVKHATIPGTSIPFFVEPGLDGFARPLYTTRNNLARMYDSGSDMTDLTVDYDPRERNIAVMMDAQAGAGFVDGSEIWTNDNI